MLKRNRGGINNLLINRLRRHANLATLFRSMDTPPPARYQPTRTVAIPAYVVPGPAPSIELPPPASIAKQEQGVKTADAMEQTTWRRLQAIYRAHEQKNDSAPEGIEPGPLEQIQPPGPGHIQRKAVQTAPQLKPPLPKTAGERTGPEPVGRVQPAAKEHPAPAAPDASDLAEQVADYADILPADEAAPAPPAPLQPQPLQAAWPVQPLRPEPGPKPGTVPEAPALDRSRMQAVVGQIPSGKPSSSSVEQIPPRRPRPQPDPTPEARLLTGDTYEPPTTEPAAEPEAVQRAEASVDRAEAAGGWRTAGRQPFTGTANAGTAAPMQDPGPEPLQAMPSRERPADAPVPDAPGELPAATHASPGDASTAQQSRPSQPVQSPPDAPLASIQRQLNPRSSDESARLEKPEGASIDAGPGAPAYIPTELGPLPADLWDLLGQPRPAPEMHKPLSGGPTQLAESGVPDQRRGGENTPGTGRWVETPPASQAPAQRAFHAETAAPSRLAPVPGRKTGPAGVLTGNAKTPPPPLSVAAPAAAFEQIQRKPIEIGEVPPPAQAEPPASGTGTGQGGEVNLDELARRVYAEVRARLAVEWERLRR
jgi:hypothetical protein